MTSKGQAVSSWVTTGSHTRCPAGHLDVWVAWHVYDGKEPGWEYLCRECGLNGPAEMKEKAHDQS